MILPEKFIIDTNVPLTANSFMTSQKNDYDWLICAKNCIEFLESVMKKREGLVLDAQDEIFNEYSNNLSFKGQPGLGNYFFKWIHDNRYSFPKQDRVQITPLGNSYAEFPDHPELANFDISDRKFIATACAHPSSQKPTIFEATDSKWWGWKKALEAVGVPVYFLGEEYVKRIYAQKFPDRDDA